MAMRDQVVTKRAIHDYGECVSPNLVGVGMGGMVGGDERGELRGTNKEKRHKTLLWDPRV